MRILICGINYAPEMTGIGKYTGEMCNWLAANGHTVEVITAMPYYPQWEINQKYKKKWWHKEYIDGVKLYRCPLYVPKKITSVKRIIHEFSFVLSTLPVWIKKLFGKKYDVVVSVSPPFHLGALPLLYSKLRRTKMVTHIQDLQVDVAKELKMINNKRLLNAMFGIEKFILKQSAAVSSISNGMLSRIIEKGIAPSSCIMFPNWVDANVIRPLSKENSLRAAYGISQTDKVVLYSGNLGEKQGLENIIEAAKKFRNDESVKFVLVGSGGGEMKLKEMVKDSGLTNIRFFPLVSYELLPNLLAMADLHLVLQKRNASDLVMPSKLTSILASGGCPLVTAHEDSSLYKVIKNYDMGLVVEPDDPVALTEGIKYGLNHDLNNYRTNARYYAANHLSKDIILRNWESSLLELAKNALEKEVSVVVIKKTAPEQKKISA